MEEILIIVFRIHKLNVAGSDFLGIVTLVVSIPFCSRESAPDPVL